MSSSNSPCAACKLLRRKCTPGCVFAPYFPPDQPQKFANVHKVFGASNVTKLLNEMPTQQREDAVNSLAYEAEARIRDPVYGCVAYISLLQLKIRQVREEITTARKELATFIGPAAGYASMVGPQLQHAAAQYQNAAQYAAGMELGVGVVPSAHHAHYAQMAMQLPHHQQQMFVDAQSMAAALLVARGQQEMMMRNQAYAHATVPGAGAATVAVVPPGSADGAPNDGVQFFLPHQAPQSADTAVAMTYRMEPERSPPPQSSGQSHPDAPHAQQRHTDGSDDGSEGATPRAP